MPSTNRLAIRHPASGYVQGINDLVTPFLMVFLQDFVPNRDVTRDQFDYSSLERQTRDNIEADSFWCMSRVLDGIQDNYTFAQPGIQVGAAMRTPRTPLNATHISFSQCYFQSLFHFVCIHRGNHLKVQRLVTIYKSILYL